jgi:hypothetical protein
MLGLVPGIREDFHPKNVDGRDKPGHNAFCLGKKGGLGELAADRLDQVEALP